MSVDLSKIGGAMLASGPLLMNLVGNKAAWWAGFTMLVVGPVLLGLKSK